MSLVGNIYDNGPISPIARIKDHVSVYTARKWSHYEVAFMEPWPRSSPLQVELVALAGLTNIPANGNIAKRVLAILQVTDDEMLQVRFEPLDDVEALIYEQSGTGRFNSRNTQARVSMTTPLRDPYLATSTFFILGYQRDMNLEVRNPNPVLLNQARFQFWGFRYVLEAIPPNPAELAGALSKAQSEPERLKIEADILKKLADGDKETAARFIGPTTWLPAEGR